MIKKEDIVGLYKKLVTQVPPYIESAINESIKKETQNSLAWEAQRAYLLNIAIARNELIPICQDTGIPKFLIKLPKGYSTQEVKNIILEAMPIATEEAYARQSGIDPLSKKEMGNEGITTFYINEWNKEYPKISLLLKGGGSENASQLFSLPDQSINADRDYEGIKRCAEYIIKNKVTSACPPVILTLGIGGTRDKAIESSQRLLFRPWGEKNSDKELGQLEKDILELGNNSNIGAQGFGGKTTLFDVRASKLPTHIASFFVDVSVNCWVYRMGNLSYETGTAKFSW